jgi:hypothetical protein
MIQLIINMTSRSLRSKEKFTRMNRITARFPSLKEARNYLKETYGKAKRSPMFIDSKKKTIRCGYIIRFKNADWSHAPVEHWMQEDWVKFEEIETVNLDERE